MGKLVAVFIWLTAMMMLPVEKYYVTFVKGNVVIDKT
ncbi:MAG: hypothetical protein JWQ25_2805, partial [Daejeonella sp.]|nr:hypothetical protein [Daejeonella sp.]